MQKTNILVDSCVFSSFIHKEDNLHENAKEIFIELFNNLKILKLIIPSLVIYEICTVAVKRNASIKIIKERISKLIDYKDVVVVSVSDMSVFKYLKRSAQQHQQGLMLKTQDLIILNTAIELDSILITTDKILLRVAKRLSVPCCQNQKELSSLLQT